ncbi:TPA: BC10 family protein [Vibrio parahaemolyticus]|nr:hypothetical protein DXJ75_12785 [Vibrio parahaemolyticus]HCH4654462.1 BC10 family protein [Vibrio parahaemolyticus]HCM1063259.1 BC10 family protein [Vibrio parahaemolyticus]
MTFTSLILFFIRVQKKPCIVCMALRIVLIAFNDRSTLSLS